MRRGSQLRTSMSLVTAVSALVIAGCGGSSSHTTTTTNKAAAASSTAAPASAPATPTGTGLSGKWSGQYSGAYSGTFRLNWTQAGSKLNGKITLSAPPGTLGITGNLSGSAIKFGTVGGVVYSGSVSGNSMSGNYQSPNGGGSWSASKS